MRFPELTKNKKRYLVVTILSILLLSLVFFFFSKWDFYQPKKEYAPMGTDIIPEKFTINFESDYLLLGSSKNSISADHALSGKHSTVIPDLNSYSSAIVFELDKTSIPNPHSINLGCWFLPVQSSMDVILVLSVFDNELQKQLYWEALHVQSASVVAGEWFYATKQFFLPDTLLNKGNKVKIYACNYLGDGHAVYIDDIEINFRTDDIPGKMSRSKLVDFENSAGDGITSRYAFQGNKSASACGENAYTSPTSIPLSEFDLNQVDRVNFRFYYLSEEEPMDYVLVFSVKDKNNNDVFWYGHHLNKPNHSLKNWIKVQDGFSLPPEVCTPDNKLYIYGWNRCSNSVYIDDILIVMKSTQDLKKGSKSMCDLTEDSVFNPRLNTPPYPFVYLKYTAGNQLIAETKNTKLSVCMNIKVLQNGYEQVLAGNSPNSLAVYYAEGSRIVIKPLKLNYKLGEKTQAAIIDWDGDKKDELCFFDNSEKKLICFRLSNNSSDVTGVKIWEKPYNSLGIISSVDGTACLRKEDGIAQAIVVLHDKKIGSFYPSENGDALFNDINRSFPEATKIYCGNILPEISGNEIFAVSKKENSMVYSIYEISIKKGIVHFKPIEENTLAKFGYDALNADSDFVFIDTGEEIPGNFLVLDRSWRFDMKLVKIGSKFYEISKTIDFSGFPDKINPKYYPNTTIICGNYTGSKTIEILCFSTNSNLPGTLRQSKLSDNKLLKSKVEIYAF